MNFCAGRFSDADFALEKMTQPDLKPCVFPFTYNGKVYAQCTKVDSKLDVPWCATTASFSDEDWRFCQP